MCVIVGLRNQRGDAAWIFDGASKIKATKINAYLLNAANVMVTAERRSLFALPEMLFGNMPRDGGHLVLQEEERDQIVSSGFEKFVKRYLGSDELIKGKDRWCLWIEDDDVEAAKRSDFIKDRLERVAQNRRDSPAVSTQGFADRPHRFVQIQGTANEHALLIPSVMFRTPPISPSRSRGCRCHRPQTSTSPSTTPPNGASR